MRDDARAREQAVATLEFLAHDGVEEADGIAQALKKGRAPDSVSDRLFSEIMEAAAPKNLAAYHRFEGTVSQLRREGNADLVARGERRRERILSDARVIENLAKLGFVPSAEQRAALFLRFRAMLELKARQSDEPDYARGIETSREVLRGTLCALSHAMGREECEFMLSVSDAAQKLAFISGWAQKAAFQSDIGALFERELSGILGRSERDAGARVQAYSLRERLRAMHERPTEPPAREGQGTQGKEKAKLR